MPLKRQTQGGRAVTSSEAGIAIRSLALRLSSGHRIERHAHPWTQLVYATRGVMSVDTAGGTWVVPPLRAVWVPADLEHGIEMTGSVSMRTLYLRPGLSPALPGGCCVVNVSPLLRELVLHTVDRGYLDESVPTQARLIGVILDQIVGTTAIPLELPLPSDPRARRVADRVRARVASSDSLQALAGGSGASKRTLERLFQSETGMSFGRWRQQLRLLHALRRLAQGISVTTTAQDVGYESTSAFIEMFRRALGTTPGRYFRARRPADPTV